MLKMERSAARAASCNTRVIDMEELKKARERRASSVRHPSVEFGDNGRDYRGQKQDRSAFREEDDDNRPFWDQEDPFRSSKPAMQQSADRQTARQQQTKPGMYQPRQHDKRKPRQFDRYESRQDDRNQHRQQARDAAGARNNHSGLYMLLVLLGLLAMAVVIGLKVFEIKDIEVKGNETMTAESVIALSGISAGENIFKVNLGLARQNLQSDPLLEVLGISRSFPDKIKIDIRQRKPHGAIAYLGSYVIIDEKGFVLDIRDSLPAGQYPLITGIDIQPSEKGKPLAGVDNGKLQMMYKLLTAIYDNKAMQYVSEANLSKDEDIRLLTGEGIEIDIGKPTDLEKKAQWITSSIPELRSKGYTSGVLYVTGANSPVFSSANTDQRPQDSSNGSNGGDGQAGKPGNAA